MDLLEKRFAELAARAVYTSRAQFTRFLEPPEEVAARTAAREAGAQVFFDGGHEDAERRRAIFTDGVEAAPPTAVLRISWNEKYASVTHRDLLGAVMGLGPERSAVGDICMGEEHGTAYLFCIEEMADWFCAQLEKAGRATVKTSRAQDVRIAPPQSTALRVTVQQLRLDALVAAAAKVSRAEAQRLIRQGLVKRNHIVTEHTDAHIEEKDLLSVRGFGRIRVDAIQGETRKGRIAVSLFHYGAK